MQTWSRSKVFLTAEQVSDLRTAFSEPIPTDDGYSRGWQTKDALQFVKENFVISYSKSRKRQIIKNLGLSKITCRPRLKRRNEVLNSKFLAEVQKKKFKKRLLNPNHLFVTRMRAVFVWIQIDQNVGQLKAQNQLNIQVVRKPKSMLEVSKLKITTFLV